jgi:hypothetical protein
LAYEYYSSKTFGKRPEFGQCPELGYFTVHDISTAKHTSFIQLCFPKPLPPNIVDSVIAIKALSVFYIVTIFKAATTYHFEKGRRKKHGHQWWIGY